MDPWGLYYLLLPNGTWHLWRVSATIVAPKYPSHHYILHHTFAIKSKKQVSLKDVFDEVINIVLIFCVMKWECTPKALLLHTTYGGCLKRKLVLDCLHCKLN